MIPLRKIVDARLLEYRTAQKTLHQQEDGLEKVQTKIKEIEEAKSFILGLVSSVQESIHRKISGVVSRCLEAVFDEPYTFRIKFVQKRGQTEVELVFERNGKEVDPLTASGGGVVDVAAFALRLASLTICRPRPRPLLVLDEPFKFVSAEYRPRLRELLETLSEEMKVQFLIVTHMEELMIGKVVEL